jgi:hypothetical protein
MALQVTIPLYLIISFDIWSGPALFPIFFNNKIELQAGFPEIIKHFEQQGQTFNYDKDFKTEVENDISQEIDNSFINEVIFNVLAIWVTVFFKSANS